MKKNILLFLNAVLLFSFYSCNELEYSPNQKFDKDSPRDLNAKNLEKLRLKEINTSTDDTVRFILTGDTQRSYDQAVDLIKVANNQYPNLDFVILNGDISDFGLLKEMKTIANIYEQLRVPYISVIGNHDLIANGSAVYQRMFGELNFSFIYKKIKFICHDANSREYKFNGKIPDLNWLGKELNTDSDVEGIVGVSHIPPRSNDFDPNLKEPYENLLNSTPKFIVSLHSHENTNDVYYPYPGGVPFIVSNAVTNREFLYVEIVDGKLLKHETIKY